MEFQDIPMGLSMALAQNVEAMQKFSNLSEVNKQHVIDGTHTVNSKSEMQQYVRDIITKY